MSDLNYDEIRARAEKRARKRAEFVQHLAVYIIVNLFLWVAFFVLAAAVTPWALIVPVLSTAGWGLAVAIHGAVYYVDTTGMDNMREREIQREIQREMEIRGISDPSELFTRPKREQTQRDQNQSVRLSDDGELIYDDETPRKTSNRKP